MLSNCLLNEQLLVIILVMGRIPGRGLLKAVDYGQILLIPLLGKYRIFQLWKIKQSVSCSILFLFETNFLVLFPGLAPGVVGCARICWEITGLWVEISFAHPGSLAACWLGWGFTHNSKMWECLTMGMLRINQTLECLESFRWGSLWTHKVLMQWNV